MTHLHPTRKLDAIRVLDYLLMRAADNLEMAPHPPGRAARRSERRGSGAAAAAGCPRRPSAMNDVTRILSAIEQGDPQAAEQLLPAGLRRAAPAGRPAAGAGEARPDPPGHGPGPRGVPPAGRTPTRPAPGTAAATSSPPPPRPCAASSSTSARRKRPQAGRRPPAASWTWRSTRSRPTPRPTTCSPSTRPSTGSRRRTAQAAELVKLRYFAGLTVEQAAAVAGHLAAHRRAPLGLRPRLALRPARPARRAGLSRDRENLPGIFGGLRPGRRMMERTARLGGFDGRAQLETIFGRCPSSIDGRASGLPRRGVPATPSCGRRSRRCCRTMRADRRFLGTASAVRPTERAGASSCRPPRPDLDTHPSPAAPDAEAPARSSAPTSCCSRSARGAWASSTWPSRTSPSAARSP